MLLLAEYVPATMLDPQAIGTAFQKKQQKVRMELHILSFIEQCSGLQGRRRCLAAGVLDIWHGTDPPDPGTARHGTSLQLASVQLGCALQNLTLGEFAPHGTEESSPHVSPTNHQDLAGIVDNIILACFCWG